MKSLTEIDMECKIRSLQKDNNDLRELLRSVMESLDVIDEMKHETLSGVVHGAFINTEQQIRAALAKRDAGEGK